jgi:hypothetical protein
MSLKTHSKMRICRFGCSRAYFPDRSEDMGGRCAAILSFATAICPVYSQSENADEERKNAVVALGTIGTPAAALQTALDDDAEASFAAAQSLAKMGDSSGQWVLEEVLEDFLGPPPSGLCWCKCL